MLNLMQLVGMFSFKGQNKPISKTVFASFYSKRLIQCILTIGPRYFDLLLSKKKILKKCVAVDFIDGEKFSD